MVVACSYFIADQGYGRTAECIQLGLEVATTAWGGNLDFVKGICAFGHLSPSRCLPKLSVFLIKVG